MNECTQICLLIVHAILKAIINSVRLSNTKRPLLAEVFDNICILWCIGRHKVDVYLADVRS